MKSQNENRLCKLTDKHQLRIIFQQNQNKQSIKITLHNKQNYDIYELLIDQSFLVRSQIKELSYLFDKPKLLFQQLREIMGELIILDDGVIKFDVSLGRSGLKSIRIPMRKKQVEKIECLLMRMNEMRQEFKNQISSIRAQYNQYIYEIKKEQNSHVEFFIKELEKANAKIEQISIIIDDHNRKIDATRRNIKRKKITAPKNNTKLKSKGILKAADKKMKKRGRKPKMQIMSSDQSQNDTQEQNIKQEFHSFMLNQSLNTSFGKFKEAPGQQCYYKVKPSDLFRLTKPNDTGYFDFYEIEKGLKVSKIIDEGFYNYVTQMTIPPNMITILKMKQERTRSGYIMFGICTPDIIGVKDSYYRNQAMAYFSQNGWIYKDGVRTDSGMKVKDGSTVKLQVNLIENTVKWSINESKHFQMKISESILKKPIHFVVMMAHHGDLVDLLTE